MIGPQHRHRTKVNDSGCNWKEHSNRPFAKRFSVCSARAQPQDGLRLINQL